MRIIINPDFDHLREYVESIPDRFETEGTQLYAGRNLIKVISVDKLDINVKRYGIPGLFNRIIYSFFRSPKGERAFAYPKILLQRGFQTPTPIAYIEEKESGLIKYSYFLSLQSPYRRSFNEFGNADIKACSDVVIAFAQYTAQLHEAGILHLDYSPGNILFDKVDERYCFSLVDINRMYFGNVDFKKGCANFARLWGQTPFFVLLAEEYARARGADVNECVRLVLEYRKKFWARYRLKHKVWFHLDI